MVKIETQRTIKLTGQEANDFILACEMAAAYIRLVEQKRVAEDQTTATQRANVARLVRQVKSEE
jgi:hypothetical protein